MTIGMVGSPYSYLGQPTGNQMADFNTLSPMQFKKQYGMGALNSAFNTAASNLWGSNWNTPGRTYGSLAAATAPAASTPAPYQFTTPSFNAGATTGAAAPSALGGPAPLTDAVKQGFGMGLAPFNTQWYDNLGKTLFNQAATNFNENINPALNSQAIAAGGYGGDRSNIAKGVMMDKLNQSVLNAMAPQYAGGYENWLNRGVQTGSAAMQGLLGLGNLDLGMYGADTQRQLGLGALDVDRYKAQTQAASAASGAAGNPVFTNPWSSAIGGAASLWALMNMFGKP